MFGKVGQVKPHEDSLSHFSLGYFRLGQNKSVYASLLQNGQVRPG